MNRSKLRLLVVAAAMLFSAAGAVPAQAAASACTHHWSGPQICISVDGKSGSPNPGHVTTAWTNPPKNRKTSTVHIQEPGGFRYTVKAHRVRGQLIASFAPGRLMADGKLCARYAGSSRTACVQMINRMM